MKTSKQSSLRVQGNALGFEIRYERSFVLDLKALDAESSQRIQKFVFEEFNQLTQLQELPNFRQLGTSKIFYRFTCDRYLIGLEITGQIIKFLRVLPLPA